MTWRIKTEGSCIWGAGFVESVPYYDAATRETSRPSEVTSEATSRSMGKWSSSVRR